MISTEFIPRITNEDHILDLIHLTTEEDSNLLTFYSGTLTRFTGPVQIPNDPADRTLGLYRTCLANINRMVALNTGHVPFLLAMQQVPQSFRILGEGLQIAYPHLEPSLGHLAEDGVQHLETLLRQAEE